MDASGADGRKSTEWFLESRYYGGVESTTRYRKGNSKSGGRNTRGERAIDGNVKAVSGRKGGYQAAQNRKRSKAEQQQEAARQRNHRLQQHGPHYYADEDVRFYPEYPGNFPANTSSPFEIQAAPSLNRHGGMHRGRQGHLDINYFQPRLPESVHDAHGKGLSGDVDPAAEPTTPPGSGHDSHMGGDLSYDNEYHPYLPGLFVHNDASYHQHHPAAAVAATTLSPSGYAQQPGYTLSQVEGVFEASSGIEVPLFLSGKSLTSEEAAALMEANPWANEGPYCG